MLNQKQIEEATGKVTCGKEQGSTFLISSSCVLTARHNICDFSEGTPINIIFPNIGENGIERSAIPINLELSLRLNIDAVVLKLNEPVINAYFELENSQYEKLAW